MISITTEGTSDGNTASIQYMLTPLESHVCTAVQPDTASRERKCVDTTGPALVPWAGHFQCKNTNTFFEQYAWKQFFSNSTRKVLWFEITKMPIPV